MTWPAEALDQFKTLYAQAQTCGLREPTAVTLATTGKDGRSTIRMVLLKSFDERGLVFYTNKESRKGRQLIENARAALCFYWPPLERQVTVEGAVQEVSASEADAYWTTRARDSQIAAWASQQSRPLKSRDELDARVAQSAVRFGSGPVPRPPYWTGFRTIPDRVEFWKSVPNRLHERMVFERKNGIWTTTLLYP